MIGLQRRWPPEVYALRIRTGQSASSALDEQIAFELGDGVDDVHGHLSRRIDEVDSAQ